VYEEIGEDDLWESRDRKVNNRRNIKNLNKNYSPGTEKKTEKPRVTENRKLTNWDSGDSFASDE
jgi:hypothetical protein